MNRADEEPKVWWFVVSLGFDGENVYELLMGCWGVLRKEVG